MGQPRNEMAFVIPTSRAATTEESAVASWHHGAGHSEEIHPVILRPFLSNTVISPKSCQ